MSWSRTAGRLIVTVAACSALTAPLRAIAAQTSAPPDGSYGYTIVRNGLKTGDSTVTVKRIGASVTVHEIETFTGVTDTVDETLDLNNLAPTSYITSFPLTAEVGITAHLAFYAGGARETVDGTSGATDFRLEGGTTRLIVVDGAMMAGFLFLPAQLRALSLTAFTVLSPSRADTYSCSVDAAANPAHSDLVPKTDISVTVNGRSPNGNTQFVEWYDPVSMVVDEVDVPAQQVTIVHKHGTT